MNKNELKEKVVDYVSKVFFYCVKRCNNRIDAEDLSQTILLEIIQAIDKGAHIDNFDYYVWGVCKNIICICEKLSKIEIILRLKKI